MGTGNGAQVKWENGHTNKYRLGAEHSIDLKCVNGGEASGGMYYPDHLPAFGRSSLACGLIFHNSIKITIYCVTIRINNLL